MLVPSPDYFLPSSFGSLELKKKDTTEFIGQQIDYSEEKCNQVKVVTIDQLKLKRLDFIKIDIEGMEIEALNGAKKSIEQFKPQLLIEKIKSNESEIRAFVEKFDYQIFPLGINILAIHNSDPVSKQLKIESN